MQISPWLSCMMAAATIGCGTADAPSIVVSSSSPLTSSKYLMEIDGRAVETDATLSSRTLSREEAGEKEFEDPGAPAPPRSESLERLLRNWEQTDGLVEVTFDFPSLPITASDRARLKGDDNTKEAYVRERLAKFAPVQAPLIAAVERVGGRVDDRRWISNQVAVSVPGDRVREVIAAVPAGTVTWSGNSYDIRPSAGYDGADMRAFLKADRYLLSGYRGCYRSPCLRIGIIEYNTDGNIVADNHYAFRRPGSTASRFISRRDCSVSGCPPYTGGTVNGTHVTGVAAAAAASIEAGQDPTVSLHTPRVERSGIAPSVDIAHYGINSCTPIVQALQAALFEGVYVVNMSFNISNGLYAWNDPAIDCAGMNSAMRDYVDYEGVIVAASGNHTVLDYPAVRPEVISVGGLDTSSSPSYEYSLRSSVSGGGSVPIVVNGTTFQHRPLNLLAPGDLELRAGAPMASYGSFVGTSAAAPQVAGLAILFRDRFTAATNGRVVQAAMLAMGDGYNGASLSTSGTSATHGAGRVRILPQSAWGYHYFSVAQGQEVCFNVGAGPFVNAASWKAGMTWDEPNLGNAADIDFRVRNAATNAVIASQTDRSILNRVRLTSAAINGLSIKACAYGFHLPAGQTRTVYIADFVQYGSTD